MVKTPIFNPSDDKMYNKIIVLSFNSISLGLDKQKKMSVYLSICSYPSVLTYVLGAQRELSH